MGTRGVTRVMAMQEAGADSGHDGGHGAPYSDARRAMLRQLHRHTLWIPWTVLLLGVWTALAPFNFGYLHEGAWVDPSGGRGVWFSDSTHTALRAWLMTGSDLLSGLLLIALGWRMLSPDRPVSWWLACGVGAWMSAAPVLFWAPTAAAYANDTLVGMLVIALTILIPGMPNMVLYMRMGGATPPGWSYNPSSWPQRWIMIVTGFLGLVVSRQLAMFQLGYVDGVWEPFFGSGTHDVLNSSMSHSLPISDAGLGALAYTFEFLMGYMGSPSRWRTMPWMVTLFGILVIPLGLVHIFLVISQPVVVGSWCTLCLVAAGVMLPMIPLEVDEVVAMGQHVKRAMRRGERFWSVFWKGGDPEGCTADERTPALQTLPNEPHRVFLASIWGMSVPRTLLAAIVLGIALMALPATLGVTAPAASVYHLSGALVVVVAAVASAEVIRIGRLLCVPLGLVVAIVPWFLEGAGPGTRLVGSFVGVLIAALGLPRGVVRESYGSWDRWVR